MILRAELRGSGAVIPLDGIEQHGYGWQVQAGVSGLGLPPVTVQWAVGVGDGASYRGTRTQPREIDLPLHLVARTHDEMEDYLEQMAIVLSAPCELHLTTHSDTWRIPVVRTGGGDIRPGVDIFSAPEFATSVTVTAGDPYFSAGKIQTLQLGGGASEPFLTNFANLNLSNTSLLGAATFYNQGDVPALPLWTVYGPATSVKLTAPETIRPDGTARPGQTLEWIGALGPTDTLVIDARNSTAIINGTTNAYPGLSVAPKFWAIPPGRSVAGVEVADTTADGKVTVEWQARRWAVV
jgi:hypothetical protein